MGKTKLTTAANDNAHEIAKPGPTKSYKRALRRARKGEDQTKPDHIKAALDRGHIGRDETERYFLRDALNWFLRLDEIAAHPEPTGEQWKAVEDGCQKLGPNGGPVYAVNPEILQGYAQIYTRAHEIKRRVMIRMDILWDPFMRALAGNTMKEIGLREGGGETTAPAKGCTRLTDALRKLASEKRKVLEEEASDDFLPVDELGLPVEWRGVANDNTRHRMTG